MLEPSFPRDAAGIWHVAGDVVTGYGRLCRAGSRGLRVYRFDWLERLKIGGAAGAPAAAARPLAHVAPVVWALGFTSLLTDVSSEMVSSVLPAYLFLHLKLSPLQYGIIDGVYNGLAVALVGLVAGHVADRHRAHKAVALAGYGLSALCKPALLLAGGMWTWILVVVGLDRLGKGLRAAPRDAMISLATPRERLATAFGVHRALDTFGAFLGPLVAVALLFAFPGGYDIVWVASFAFAVLGVATLALFVRQPRLEQVEGAAGGAPAATPTPRAGPRFGWLALGAFVLALVTISDGFAFLLLHQASGLPLGAFPLYYVAVSAVYMLAAIPVGRLADRYGWRTTVVGGYLCLLAAYGGLYGVPAGGLELQVWVVLMLGLYYAGTEGVLIAIASSLLPPERRTRGLALLAAAVGLGKASSSVIFGWLLQRYGAPAAIAAFASLLPLATLVIFVILRRIR
jgi:MFS family permease